MADKTYIPCPMCTKNWVDEAGELPLCGECNREYDLIKAVNQLVLSADKLKTFNYNMYKFGHIQVIRGAITKLEGLINVLEKYPRQ